MTDRGGPFAELRRPRAGARTRHPVSLPDPLPDTRLGSSTYNGVQAARRARAQHTDD